MRVGPLWLLLLPLGIASAVELANPQPELVRVKRVYVEQLGGGQNSDQLRDMIITALQNSKLFSITENQEHADAVLKGSADDKIYNELHDTSDSIGLHANAGNSSASHNSMSGGLSSSVNAGAGITSNETSHIQERHHEASASVRLVDTGGDVIWSSTQESNGGKFRGAMADVADKIARQLSDDIRKARSAGGSDEWKALITR
jgi:hypothetical protein